MYKKLVAVVVMVEADGDLLVSSLNKRVHGDTVQNRCDESWVEDVDIFKMLPLPTIDNR